MDDTPREQMKVERMASVESTCRNNTAEENLSLWKEMVNDLTELSHVAYEVSLTCTTLTSRSTILFTTVATLDPHHRVGSTYKAYPTYDFVCPFVDALQGSSLK